MKGFSLTTRELLLLAAALAAGAALRAARLDATPFWLDEAESSLNALTILQNGVPGDAYMGQPIFENTLTEPWPGHPEYEFRDSSYSNHLAVYHAWLPLYSIAASFALHGVRPDGPPAVLRSRHDFEEQKRRTRAGRMPAVVFGTLFLALVFFAATELYGRDAGWAALVFASFHEFFVSASRQARYYSAEILLTTACCFALWLMASKGRWKHFLWGGVLFSLLFYTHILSFAAAGLTVLIVTPFILLRREQALPKLAAFGAIVIAAIAPWIWATGFYAYQNRIPRGWTLLSIQDLLALPPARPIYLLVGGAFIFTAAWVLFRHPAWPERWKSALAPSWWPLAYLGAWALCGYVSFLAFMPAASFFSGRLKLEYWGPALLGASIISAAIARIVAPGFRLGAPLVLLLFAALLGTPFRLPSRYETRSWDQVREVLAQVDAMNLERNARLYAMPHMILTFYSGMPFQSIWPVRRSFLDTYPGEIVFVDADDFPGADDLLAPTAVQSAARSAGVELTDKDARRWSWLLVTRDYRERMVRITGGDIAKDLEQIPAFAAPLLAAERVERKAGLDSGMHPGLMWKGFDVNIWPEFEDVFLYRFVDPLARTGANQNYAKRFRGTTARILTKSYKVIYRASQPDGSHPARGIRFEFVY